MWSADDGVNDADDGVDETKIFYPGAIPRITDLVYPSVRRDLLLVRPGSTEVRTLLIRPGYDDMTF